MTAPGRLLACTRCREHVRVLEAPVEFIDPDLFVCGNCLKPVPGQTSLELDHAERVEQHDYDPATALIPF